MENVGLSVYEGVSAGASPFNLPAKRNIGLLIESLRGVENVPQRVLSQADALALFGDVSPDFFGALVLQDLFANAAPYVPTLYVSRIIGAASTAALKTSVVFGASMTFGAGFQGKADKGTWGNGLTVELSSPGGVAASQYALTVKLNSKPVEQFLSDTVAKMQDDVNQLSSFITMTVAAEPVMPTQPATVTVVLAGGTYVAPTIDEYTPVFDPIAPKGLAVFEGYDVQVLAVSEESGVTIASALLNYCNLRGDVHAVCVLPFRATRTMAQAFSTALQTGDRSRISVYDHWRKVKTATGSAWIPGVGYVLGAGFVRTPAKQGDYIHIPPAGLDSLSTGAIECAPARRSQGEINFYTRELTINSVFYVDRVGYFIGTSRTMSTNELYQSIHTGLQASYYVRAVNQNMLYVLQKPNLPTLAREMYVSLYTFFKDEYAVGALEKGIPFEKAAIFTIAPIDPKARKVRIATIDYIPSEATESVRINVNRNDGSLLTTTSDN